ncbi:hypothetical protein DDK01_17925 [Mycobacteroides abscessus]|uniref:hypothetical protein n=1 Tax=Mycobacteroides abscessus TaxID=36809 RepID=UPI000D3E4EFE|nr:hypothetical protein [Mycobacteroides abscessus]PVA91837.1 hypothetical protein DDK01_17925 [Mycobacteroides abscessus]
MSSSEKEAREEVAYQELASAIFDGLASLYRPAMNAIREATGSSRGTAELERYLPLQRDFEAKLRELEEKLTKIAELNGYHHQYPDPD